VGELDTDRMRRVLNGETTFVDDVDLDDDVRQDARDDVPKVVPAHPEPTLAGQPIS
jgi:hypothetical protein